MIAVLLAAAAAGLDRLPLQEATTVPATPRVAAPPAPLVPGAALPARESLPLLFTRAPRGSPPGVRVLARGNGFRFGFARDHVLISLAGRGGATTLALRFVGASKAGKVRLADRTPAAMAELSPAGGGFAAPAFATVVYDNLWPGIDMVFSGTGGTLKYAFRVRAGASPAAIRLAYRGVRGARLAAGGALVLATPLGPLRDTRPVSEQRTGGESQAVATRFLVHERTPLGVEFGFALGSAYDPARPLLIDPGIVYATLLRGQGDEEVHRVALGPDGAIYLTGYTKSVNFPATIGAFDETGNGHSDVFVTKMDPTGSTVLYSTYIGGGNYDVGQGIDVGPDGSAYVVGVTESPGFPTTPGALDRTLSGEHTREGFALRLNPSGSELLYSTFLGGSRDDLAHAVAVDETGNAYVTGDAWSPDFPTTPGAYDRSYDAALLDSPDVFVSKLAPGGSLVYSTFIGAANDDFGQAIGVDSAGNATVAGTTASLGFPTTPGADDATLAPPSDGFVTTVDASGADLAYSSFLGGSDFEDANAVAVAPGGNVYVGGATWSADFPTTPGADQTFGGDSDGFVTRVDPSSGVVYSTFVGGSSGEGTVPRLDGAGTVYVGGTTASTDFPVTPDAAQPAFGGETDAFVLRLTSTGALDYGTYLGGPNGDSVSDLAVDSVGVLYLVGSQASGSPAPAAALAGPDLDVSVRTFVAACSVEGTNAGERLVGTIGRDVICGGGGADVIDAGGGNDIVLLGPGGGVARGGWGIDALMGSTRSDRLLGGGGRDLVDGGGGRDALFGGGGPDLLIGRGGADLIHGEGGLDLLFGGAEGDVLRGGTGHDRLSGSAGRDRLYGSGGRDRLQAGTGRDLCRGGPGRDILRACER